MSTYPVLNDKPIDKWKFMDLKNELRRRNLPSDGLKEVLVERLLEELQADILGGERSVGGSPPNDELKEDETTELSSIFPATMSTCPVLNGQPIDQWKFIDLKNELSKRNLPSDGLKEVLVQRLLEELQADILSGERSVGGSPPKDDQTATQTALGAATEVSDAPLSDMSTTGTVSPSDAGTTNKAHQESAPSGSNVVKEASPQAELPSEIIAEKAPCDVASTDVKLDATSAEGKVDVDIVEQDSVSSLPDASASHVDPLSVDAGRISAATVVVYPKLPDKDVRIDQMLVPELRFELRIRNLSADGTAEVLLQRLFEALESGVAPVGGSTPDDLEEDKTPAPDPAPAPAPAETYHSLKVGSSYWKVDQMLHGELRAKLRSLDLPSEGLREDLVMRLHGKLQADAVSTNGDKLESGPSGSNVVKAASPQDEHSESIARMAKEHEQKRKLLHLFIPDDQINDHRLFVDVLHGKKKKKTVDIPGSYRNLKCDVSEEITRASLAEIVEFFFTFHEFGWSFSGNVTENDLFLTCTGKLRTVMRKWLILERLTEQNRKLDCLVMANLIRVYVFSSETLSEEMKKLVLLLENFGSDQVEAVWQYPSLKTEVDALAQFEQLYNEFLQLEKTDNKKYQRIAAAMPYCKMDADHWKFRAQVNQFLDGVLNYKGKSIGLPNVSGIKLYQISRVLKKKKSLWRYVHQDRMLKLRTMFLRGMALPADKLAKVPDPETDEAVFFEVMLDDLRVNYMHGGVSFLTNIRNNNQHLIESHSIQDMQVIFKYFQVKHILGSTYPTFFCDFFLVMHKEGFVQKPQRVLYEKPETCENPNAQNITTPPVAEPVKKPPQTADSITATSAMFEQPRPTLIPKSVKEANAKETTPAAEDGQTVTPVIEDVVEDQPDDEEGIPEYAYDRLRTSSKNPVTGIDQTRREAYLSPAEFMENFLMTREDFLKLPKWRQDRLKIGLQLLSFLLLARFPGQVEDRCQ